MEDSLVHIEAHLINVCNNVLILVVMEDSLVLLKNLKIFTSILKVLILVVMEDSLVLVSF